MTIGRAAAMILIAAVIAAFGAHGAYASKFTVQSGNHPYVGHPTSLCTKCGAGRPHRGGFHGFHH